MYEVAYEDLLKNAVLESTMISDGKAYTLVEHEGGLALLVGEEIRITTNNQDPLSNLNAWYLYCNGPTVTMRSLDSAGKVISLAYSSGSADWGMQLLYKNSELSQGATYTLSFTLESNVEFSFRVHGATKTAAVGKTQFTVEYAEGQGETKSSFELYLGAARGNARVTISDWSWSLVAPPEPQPPEVQKELKSGDNNAAEKQHETWFYYASSRSVTENSVDTDAKTLTLTYTVTGGSYEDYTTQILYINDSLERGREYELVCTITLNCAGTINVNGQDVTFEAGETKQLQIRYTEGQGKTQCSFCIWMGNVQSADGGNISITVKDWAWNPVT